jgi:ribosomal protein L44E
MGRRGQHYTRGTVSAPLYCRKCDKVTQHRIEENRKAGACLECIDRLEDDYRRRHGLPPIQRETPAVVSGEQTEIPLPCVCNAIAHCWKPPRPNMPHYHPERANV